VVLVGRRCLFCSPGTSSACNDCGLGHMCACVGTRVTCLGAMACSSVRHGVCMQVAAIGAPSQAAALCRSCATLHMHRHDHS
jgi:hypothetical protein